MLAIEGTRIGQENHGARAHARWACVIERHWCHDGVQADSSREGGKDTADQSPN